MQVHSPTRYAGAPSRGGLNIHDTCGRREEKFLAVAVPPPVRSEGVALALRVSTASVRVILSGA